MNDDRLPHATNANQMRENIERAGEIYDVLVEANLHPEVMHLLWLRLARHLKTAGWNPDDLARDAAHHARMQGTYPLRDEIKRKHGAA